MRAAAPLLLLLAGPQSADAARIIQHQGAASAAAAGTEARAHAAWEQLSQRFCVDSEAELGCDEHSVINVYSAFYGRSSIGGKCKPVEAGSGVESCSKNATDAVFAKCHGQRRCVLPASFHPTCKKHYSMRAVWECVAGDPPTSDSDVRHPATPEEELEKNKDEDDQEETVKAPLKGEDDIAEKVKDQRSKPELVVQFNPCYRRSRWQMIRAMTPFARLTTCPTNEGCFELKWEDGRTYEDPQEPPTRRAMLEASLAPGRNLWVSWWGMGLRRNHYYTWGVCLPKTEGVNFAIGVFNSLKEY